MNRSTRPSFSGMGEDTYSAGDDPIAQVTVFAPHVYDYQWQGPTLPNGFETVPDWQGPSLPSGSNWWILAALVGGLILLSSNKKKRSK